jgi:hypothetical protein
MSTAALASFSDGLAHLRRTLADADPFAAHDEPAAFAEALRRVTGAVAEAAPAGEQSRYLLRALDDAVAALEVAARLADELYGALPVAVAPGDGATPSAAEALRMAYTRFVESQPLYQALYHYRNAVADQLRAASSSPSATDA